MLRLDIPQVGEEASSTKDLVFQILSQEQPLSLKEIANHVKKKHNVSITYQAVRKAVDSLVNQNILEKHDRKYKISRKWVLQTKSFFDKLLTTYSDNKTVHNFSEEIAKENYAVYTFTSLFELDNFWSEFLEYWADHRGKEKPVAINYGHYTWWMLINLGQETKQIEKYQKKKIDTYFIWFRDLGLNHYAAEVYRKFGHNVLVTEDTSIDPLIAVNVMGDTVLQVIYPEHIVDRIKDFFEKYQTMEGVSMQEITEIVHAECDIQFIVFKNSTIAQNLREKYLSYF